MPPLDKIIFEWDENKNRLNIERHGIDFSIASKIFEQEHWKYQSPRNNEMRYVAVGPVDGKIIAVVYTVRHEKIRLISARHAWKKEKIAYRALYGRHAPRTH